MALLAGVVVGRVCTPDRTCTGVLFLITDSAERQYTDAYELTRLLRQHDLYPVGQPLRLVSLQAIENAIAAHPMVRRCECYATPQGEVRIRLSQRIPLLRVATAAEVYYIDTDHRRMPARESVRADVLVATGMVGEQTARTTYADFAEWLQSNSYWRQRIRQIQVQNPNLIYLLQQGDHTEKILLGQMTDYRKKLDKLRIYYERTAHAQDLPAYTELDVRYQGQVVAR